jgi:hypothetical protein
MLANLRWMGTNNLVVHEPDLLAVVQMAKQVLHNAYMVLTYMDTVSPAGQAMALQYVQHLDGLWSSENLRTYDRTTRVAAYAIRDFLRACRHHLTNGEPLNDNVDPAKWRIGRTE